MASIPGLPGESEPSFQTGDRGWMSLDQVVIETVSWLAREDEDVSPFAVKATIQLLRQKLQSPEEPGADALFLAVHQQLRRRHVLLPEALVERIVRVYASVVSLLDIRDTSELGP